MQPANVRLVYQNILLLDKLTEDICNQYIVNHLIVLFEKGFELKEDSKALRR